MTKRAIIALSLLCLGNVAFTDKPVESAKSGNQKPARDKMVIESLTGAVTQTEINAFKEYMESFPTPPGNSGNGWVFGNPGKAIEACGMMYEISHDKAILDKMIFLCDGALSGRNDLASMANGGQKVVWTGKVEPVWPSSKEDVVPAGAGVEQGATLSHMAYCAYLILQTPAIWDEKVTIGDAHNFGATYKTRALKYITEGDYVMDNWIIPYFIRTSDNNHYYFPGAPNTYKPNDPAPWNQAWLLTDGFTRLSQCHQLLNDAPGRLAKYDAIVKPNIKFFFENTRPAKSAAGTACATWAYAYPKGMEDTNHFAYDAEGLWIAYNSGRYGLTADDILPFANTYVDVVLGTVSGGRFAGRVDGSTGTGHGGGDDYVRDEYIYLTEFRPDAYQLIGSIEVSKKKYEASPQICARLLWEKNRRHLNGK